MSDNTFNIANPIKVANPIADLDDFYGPYATVADACIGVPIGLRKGGRKVGVYVDGKVVDYYWPSDDKISDGDLEQKVSSSSSGGTGSGYKTLTVGSMADLDAETITESIYLVKGAIEGMMIKVGDSAVVHQYNQSQYNNSQYQ